jgi:hypothetical protein
MVRLSSYSITLFWLSLWAIVVSSQCTNVTKFAVDVPAFVLNGNAIGTYSATLSTVFYVATFNSGLNQTANTTTTSKAVLGYSIETQVLKWVVGESAALDLYSGQSSPSPTITSFDFVSGELVAHVTQPLLFIFQQGFYSIAVDRDWGTISPRLDPRPAAYKGVDLAAPISDRYLYFSDEHNFCIRRLDFLAGDLSDYVGSCGVVGSTTSGDRTDVRLGGLTNLVQGGLTLFFVNDRRNRVLLRINGDIVTPIVTTETSEWTPLSVETITRLGVFNYATSLWALTANEFLRCSLLIADANPAQRIPFSSKVDYSPMLGADCSSEMFFGENAIGNIIILRNIASGAGAQIQTCGGCSFSSTGPNIVEQTPTPLGVNTSTTSMMPGTTEVPSTFQPTKLLTPSPEPPLDSASLGLIVFSAVLLAIVLTVLAVYCCMRKRLKAQEATRRDKVPERAKPYAQRPSATDDEPQSIVVVDAALEDDIGAIQMQSIEKRRNGTTNRTPAQQGAGSGTNMNNHSQSDNDGESRPSLPTSAGSQSYPRSLTTGERESRGMSEEEGKFSDESFSDAAGRKARNPTRPPSSPSVNISPGLEKNRISSEDEHQQVKRTPTYSPMVLDRVPTTDSPQEPSSASKRGPPSRGSAQVLNTPGGKDRRPSASIKAGGSSPLTGAAGREKREGSTSGNGQEPSSQRSSISDYPTFGSPNQTSGRFEEGTVSESAIAERCDLIAQGRYSKVKLVGRGAGGSVYRCLLENGATVAMKEVQLEVTSTGPSSQLGMSQSDKESLERQYAQVEAEVAILRHVQHRNIVQYYCCMRQSEDLVLLFMEFVAGGSVGAMIRGMQDRLSETVAKNYVSQILTALARLHERGVVHRDLKCDNLLLTLGGTVKLADFGTARNVGLGTMANKAAQSLVGTPYFIAPEIIMADELQGYGPKADIWSLGITTSELLSRGELPWPNFQNPGMAFIHIAEANRLPDFPSHLSDLARDFCLQCCKRDPEDRPSAAQLMDHPWLLSSAIPSRRRSSDR